MGLHVFILLPEKGILICVNFWLQKVSDEFSSFNNSFLIHLLGCDENIRDKYGFSASYWAKQNGHKEIMDLLPNPLKISKEEYMDNLKSYWAAHGVKPGGGGKKKKKGKGKKKK